MSGSNGKNLSEEEGKSLDNDAVEIPSSPVLESSPQAEESSRCKSNVTDPAESNQVNAPRLTLWNPNAVAIWSILFTPVFGGWLQAKNWVTLGEPAKANESILWGYVGCVSILLLVLFNGIANIPALIFFLVWPFAVGLKQAKYIREKRIEYEKRSIFRALGIGIVFFILYLVLATMVDRDHMSDLAGKWVVDYDAMVERVFGSVEELASGEIEKSKNTFNQESRRLMSVLEANTMRSVENDRLYLVTETADGKSEEPISTISRLEDAVTGKVYLSGNVITSKLQIAGKAPEKRRVGAIIPYEVDVKNVGKATTEEIDVYLALPDGTSLESAGKGGRIRGGTVLWRINPLTPNESKKLVARVVVHKMMIARVEATAKTLGADPVKAVMVTDVEGVPALLGSLVDINDPVALGENEVYSFSVLNQGSLPATKIKVKCVLESAMEYVKSSGPTKGALEENTLTFNPLPTLAPYAKATWNITVKAVKRGDVRFAVYMESDQLTKPVELKEATHFFEVSPDTRSKGVAALLLRVSDLNDPVPMGESEIYIVKVTNQGSLPLTNIRVSCDLENSMEYMKSAGPTKMVGEKTAGKKVFEFGALESLAPRYEAVWHIYIKALKEGDFRFNVRIMSDQLTRPVNENESTTFYSLATLASHAEANLEITEKAVKNRDVRFTAYMEGDQLTKPVELKEATRFSDVSPDIQRKGVAALLLQVSDLDDPVPVGEIETYIVKVANQGSLQLTNIKMSCDLENSMEYVKSSGPTKMVGEKTAGKKGGNKLRPSKSTDTTKKRVVEFGTLESLPPGYEAVWHIYIKSHKEGDFRFNVRIMSDQLTRPVNENESTTFYSD